MTTDARPVDTGLSALSDLNVANDDDVSRLSFEDQCDIHDMIARPYWVSLFAQKAP